MMCKHTPCLQLLEVQGNGLTWDDDLMECLARLSQTLGISTLSKQAFRDSNATCFYEEQLWWRVQQIHENILSSLCQCVCLYWTNCLVQLKKSMQELIRIKSNPQQQLRIKDCLISACSPSSVVMTSCIYIIIFLIIYHCICEASKVYSNLGNHVYYSPNFWFIPSKNKTIRRSNNK